MQSSKDNQLDIGTRAREYPIDKMAYAKKSLFQEDAHDSGLGSLCPLSSNFYEREQPEELSLLENDFMKMQISSECPPGHHDSGVYFSGQYNSYDSSKAGGATAPDRVVNDSMLEKIDESLCKNTARDGRMKFQITLEQIVQLYEGDRDGDNKLHLSIINGHSECAHLLINLVPDHAWLSYSNNLRQTPLHLAVLTCQPSIVRHLVCAGAVVSTQDKQGDTPLHIACRLGYEDCVKHLLNPAQNEETLQNSDIPCQRVPQDLTVRNFEGETCLHIAVKAGHYRIVQMLLHSGADINVGDGKSGRSVLHLAADKGDAALVEMLLSWEEVNVQKQDYAGLTPAQVAWGRNNVNIVNIFSFMNDFQFSVNHCENMTNNFDISESSCARSVNR